MAEKKLNTQRLDVSWWWCDILKYRTIHSTLVDENSEYQKLPWVTAITEGKNRLKSKLSKCMILRHNNAWPYTTKKTNHCLQDLDFELLHHPTIERWPGIMRFSSLAHDSKITYAPNAKMSFRMKCKSFLKDAISE